MVEMKREEVPSISNNRSPLAVALGFFLQILKSKNERYDLYGVFLQ